MEKTLLEKRKEDLQKGLQELQIKFAEVQEAILRQQGAILDCEYWIKTSSEEETKEGVDSSKLIKAIEDTNKN